MGECVALQKHDTRGGVFRFPCWLGSLQRQFEVDRRAETSTRLSYAHRHTRCSIEKDEITLSIIVLVTLYDISNADLMLGQPAMADFCQGGRRREPLHGHEP